MHHLGVDTGGTFTDFVLFEDGSNRLETFKLRSVPGDPAAAVEAGLARLNSAFGVPASALGRLIFGTTVATNAILEGKGAHVALLTTRGTRDVLEIQRQWRRRLFDLELVKPRPLVPRRHRIEVAERVDARGQVIEPLTDAEIDRCAAELAKLPIEAVAISLLFSFLRPEHEMRLAEGLVARLPYLQVCRSSLVSPEFREYERTATTVMNAYTMPKIAWLASRLEAVLEAAGFRGTFGLMQSNGGLMGLHKARTHPVNTLLSGPAGGVVGAVAVAGVSGFGNLLGLDVGGTSTDLSLVEDGRMRLSPEGGIAGYPVKVPQLRVHTIGAGGGSIARPLLGTLKVGPQSAGATPGPVCYGGGGTEPTSTDAALCLGYIDPGYFLGGEIALDIEGARAAIRQKVAMPLDMSVDEAALAIVRVQVSTIVGGLRSITVEAGRDPREFTLLPFGGAGGLYAGMIAAEAGMARVLVPRHPSVLSALGMLMTDVRHDLVATLRGPLDAGCRETFLSTVASLSAQARERLDHDGLPRDGRVFELSCDMRYVGQAYEINIPVRFAAGDSPEAAFDPTAIAAAFHAEHRRVYGHASEVEPIELVNLRAAAIGIVSKARLAPLPPNGRAASPKGHRPVLFDLEAGWQDCPVFERAAFGPGASLTGPAIIEEPGASIPLFPGQCMAVDRFGNLIVDTGARRPEPAARELEAAP